MALVLRFRTNEFEYAEKSAGLAVDARKQRIKEEYSRADQGCCSSD